MDGDLKYSILHATWGRPEKAKAARDLWFQRAANPATVEYVFAVNEDDPTRQQLGDCGPCVIGSFHGSAPAWDAAAAVSHGLWLIQGQDDIEPPVHWDLQIENVLEKRHLTKRTLKEPAFIAVSDGYRIDTLCCTAIMNRARYRQCGEFLHAGYKSVFSDDDVTIRAYGDALDGKCILVDARQELVFRHEHAYHNPAVPIDATYQRENSHDAYALGAVLFANRNQSLIARGLRTWA